MENNLRILNTLDDWKALKEPEDLISWIVESNEVKYGLFHAERLLVRYYSRGEDVSLLYNYSDMVDPTVIEKIVIDDSVTLVKDWEPEAVPMSSSGWDYPIVNPKYYFSEGFHDVVFYLKDNANLDYMFDGIVMPISNSAPASISEYSVSVYSSSPSYDSIVIGIQNYSETATTDVGMVSGSGLCMVMFLDNYEPPLKGNYCISTLKLSDTPTGYLWGDSLNDYGYLAFGSKIYSINQFPGCAAFLPANLSILFYDGDLDFSGVYSALLEQIDNFNYISNYQSYEKGSDYITIYTDDYEATFNSDDTTGSITYYSSEK